MADQKQFGIGFLGLGTVAQSAVRILQKEKDNLSRALGAGLEIRKVLVRDPAKLRECEIDKNILTTDVNAVLEDPSIDIVVELMGGMDSARFAVLEALRRDKQVVSANKALIAAHGPEIFALALEKQRDFAFEAAVAGGIPIIRTLREAFIGNRIKSLRGIVNGTCNYILSNMTEALEQGQTAADFQTFLDDAKAKGYAEADPTMDIDGTDAAQKLGILASLAFGSWIDWKTIHREGIQTLRMLDFAMAREFGYRIKLLAIAREAEEGFGVRVQPVLLERHQLLATVDGVFNAIEIDGEPLGRSLFYGRGAGGGPTATAVVADIVDVARNLLFSAHARVPLLPKMDSFAPKPEVSDIKKLQSRFYIRFMVVDRPGALASITQILGKHQISISAMVQKERSKQAPVPVIILTHHAKEKDLAAALKEIDQLEVIVDKTLRLPIEDFSA